MNTVSLALTPHETALLQGEGGEAARLSMKIIVRMAEILNAPALQEISQAHIDGCGLLSDASLQFAETMAGHQARCAVPTTLNMGPIDLQHWRDFDIPQEYAERALRQGKAYEDMGCLPTWTCAPYQGYLAPRFGQQLAWGESNAVCYANSVLGARTNRCADYLDLCAAITGRVPCYGLHLDENRQGEILVRTEEVPHEWWQDNTSWSVLGHLVGAFAGERIPVLTGLPTSASSDQFKALCAAAASSGGVPMFHAVGLTPEAPDLESCFGGRAPVATKVIDVAEMERGRADLSTAGAHGKLDEVFLGCPHFSVDEFRQLAELLQSQPEGGFHPRVGFTVTTSRATDAVVRSSNFHAILARWGVRVTLDTCVFHTPLMRKSSERIMTMSGKCAYYAPGELKVEVAFGSLEECVRAAVTGWVPPVGGR